MSEPLSNRTTISSFHLVNLRSSLYEKWQEIESIGEDIKAASNALAELKQTEQELRNAAAETARMLSPFQRLPQDILGGIAGKICLVHDAGDLEVFDVSTGIWPLTYVCRSWRIGIISLPYLWSSFSINHRSESLQPLETYLDRSRRHPLSFKLNIFSTNEDEHGFEITSLLAKQSERWRSIHLIGPIPSASLLSLHRRLPLLQDLTWYLETPELRLQWTDSEIERKIFEDAPKLTKLDYQKSPIENFNALFEFPVQQLREVRYIWCPKSEAEFPLLWDLDDFSKFTSLVNLYIYDADGPRSEWEGKEILLPALKYITLERRIWLLRAFLTPLLQSITLRDCRIDKQGSEDITNFLASLPEGQVTALHLSGPIGEEGILPLLSHNACCSLRTLSIEDQDDSEYHCGPVIKSLLKKMTFKPHQDDSSIGAEHTTLQNVLLAQLRNFELNLIDDFPKGGIVPFLRDFVLSRTLLVDEENRKELERYNQGVLIESSAVPIRLESINIDYGAKMPAITMKDVRRLEQV